MKTRDTAYAREIVSVDIDGCRLERLFVKNQNREEIRLSLWIDGKMEFRPIDLPEEELLPLMQKAISAGVFSDDFLEKLRTSLNER